MVEIGDKHIGRPQKWVDPDGVSHDWFLTYRGQPFSCRNCFDEWHDNGVCPKWENKKKDEDEGQQKYVFFGTSTLRHATDTKNTGFDLKNNTFFFSPHQCNST